MPRLRPASPGCRRRRLALLGGLVLLWALLAVSQAQITLDGSLGPRGPLTGPNYRIGAELGQIRGGNLFHSFEQFNVPTGGSATFTGPDTIANILSRVTGGQASEIDGRLQSTISGANLYLLNPSGVLFGPNASLAVSGSFHVSTADFVRLADGATFFATLGQESVLTVASPAAFGFLGNNPAAIVIRESVLRVPTGKTLSIVGGDIEIVGGPLGLLSAPSGRIQLASVASAGEVRFSPLELAPDLQVDGFARLGRVTLLQDALLHASGNGGGTVFLRAGRLLVDQSLILANNTGPADATGLGLDLQVAGDATITNGSLLITDSFAAGRARDLRLTAGTVHMDESFIGSRSFSSGDGGDIVVKVGNLTLTGGAQIDSRTVGSGRGGELTVAATDAITIGGRDQQGFASGLFSNTSSLGNAGRLRIATPTLQMDGGLIQAGAAQGSRGNAGHIALRVGRLTLTGGAEIGSGEAGLISLEAPQLQDVLKRLQTTSTRSLGRGGDVTVTAADTIAIGGRDTQGNPSGLFSNSTGLGDAGSLFRATPTLRLEDRGGITAIAFGAGSGGGIALAAGRVTLTGGARIDSGSFGRGRGGAVTLRAQDLQLTDGAVIAASSFGSGDAGTIRIQAGERFRSQQGSVAAAAARAGGGTIEVHAGRLVQLLDSELTTSIRGGGAEAGNLTLNAPLVVTAGSQSIANAFEGRGGNLAIAAEVLLADPSSRLAASGTLEITGAVTGLTGAIAPLPQAFMDVAVLLPARCAARFSGGKASSLVLGGRGGLPLEPGGVLPSPLAIEERLAADPAVIGAPHQQTSAAKFALLAGQEKALPRFGCLK